MTFSSPASAESALVSVIIPTYNRCERIGAAIESVQAQSYPHIQLIVCDDGSTDDTGLIIRTTYPDVEYIQIPHGGPAAARNAGLARAKGTLIASLDSDDRWEKDFLASGVEKIERDRLDFVFSNWIQEYPGGVDRDFFSHYVFLERYYGSSPGDWKIMESAELRTLYLQACPSPSSSALVRKSSIVSGWTKEANADDWCLFLDMILAGPCRAAFTLRPLWNKKVGADNIFDGRRKMELLELHDISDSLMFIKRYKDVLTPAETALLRERCAGGYVELAKYQLLKRFNVIRAFALLRQSVILDWRQTLVAVPHLFLIGIRNHFPPRSPRG